MENWKTYVYNILQTGEVRGCQTFSSKIYLMRFPIIKIIYATVNTFLSSTKNTEGFLTLLIRNWVPTLLLWNLSISLNIFFFKYQVSFVEVLMDFIVYFVCFNFESEFIQHALAAKGRRGMYWFSSSWCNFSVTKLPRWNFCHFSSSTRNLFTL